MKNKINPISIRNLRRGNPAWGKKSEGTGKSGNTGNHHPKKADCLLSCIKEELAKKSLNGISTKEQMIAAALVGMAEKGNLKAIELVLEYTAVKPKSESSVELSGGFKVIWDGNRGIDAVKQS